MTNERLTVFFSADPEVFAHNIAAVKAAHKYGACVDAYAAGEYVTMSTYLTLEGTAGFAVKADGDLVSVFSAPGSGVNAATILRFAVGYGAKRLDCFDTVLPDIYAAAGFVEVSRTSFDDDYRPEGWDYELYSEYNDGRPDVIFMVHGAVAELAEFAPLCESYDQARDVAVAVVDALR